MKLLFIPDTQVKQDVPLSHLSALANYTLEHKPDIIVWAGDHADMPSLSQYEKRGSKYFHGKNYAQDIESAQEGMRAFYDVIDKHNSNRSKNRKRKYKPHTVMTLGNHEYRIIRAVHEDPRLEGTIGVGDLKYEKMGIIVHPYKRIIDIEGVLFSHVFENPDSMMGNPVSGTIENKLRLIGQSFVMGHQQKRQIGLRYAASGREMHGLVCGSFYQHGEDFLGEQGNNYWRGAFILNDIQNGGYDIMPLSISYLLRRWL